MIASVLVVLGLSFKSILPVKQRSQMDKRFKHVMTQVKLVKNMSLVTMQESVKQTLALGVHGIIVQVIAWKHLMKYQPRPVENGAKTTECPIA